MIVSTAAHRGSVISDDRVLMIVVSTAATASLSSDATNAAPSSTPRIALITNTIRYITTSAPNVGHQRPRTSRNERPSALLPRTSSDSSAGKLTDQATNSQTPGKNSAMSAGISPSENRIESQIRGRILVAANDSDSPTVAFSPR